jgi:hypothetical protein
VRIAGLYETASRCWRKEVVETSVGRVFIAAVTGERQHNQTHKTRVT